MSQHNPLAVSGQTDRPDSLRRAYFAVTVLFAVNLVGYLDRQLINLLVQPIKSSLGLSDGEIGLLQGPAFIFAFSLAGLAMGRWVDQRNRRNLLILSVLIWSASVSLGGAAQNGWQLFVARMGVGVGEATLLPSAISLIADYFSPDRRGRALGFFSTGIYAGAGLSLVAVAFALPSLAAWAASMAAHGTTIEPWRLVMFAMLIPGLACCSLLLLIHEPVRAITHLARPQSGWPGARYWLEHRRLFLPHHFGLAIATLCAHSVLAWFPTILVRQYSYSAAQAGLTYGSVVAVVGCISAYYGGALGDRAGRTIGVKGRLTTASNFTAVGLVGFILFCLNGQAATFAGAVLITGGLGVTLIIGLLSLSDLAPPDARGQVASIYLIFTGILGSAIGPALVGYSNDIMGSADRPLSLVVGVIGVVGTISAGLLIRLSAARVLNQGCLKVA